MPMVDSRATCANSACSSWMRDWLRRSAVMSRTIFEAPMIAPEASSIRRNRQCHRELAAVLAHADSLVMS